MSSPPTPQSTPPSPEAAQEAADWRSSVQAGHYAQAEARHRALVFVGQGDPELQAALEALLAWQKAIRAKRYAPAQKLLPALEPLAGTLDLGAVRVGTEALLSTEGERRIVEEAELRRVLEPAGEHPTTRAEALNQLGVLQALQENPDAARESFGTALEADPEHYRALTNLGNLLLEGGNPHAAEEHYRRALALEPDYPLAHNNLAAALRKQKRVNESVRSLKQSRRLEHRRMQEDARAEMKEKLGGRSLPPWLSGRTGQYLMIALIVFLVWFFFLRG